MKYIFWGTPQFGAIILEKLIKENLSPLAVVTSLDKPQGRKRILTPSLVKKIGQKYELPIFQPKKLKNNQQLKEQLLNLAPDFFLVAGYGKILPLSILNIPSLGSLNIHPSLLPKYRGPSPIQATILAGEKETGVSLMLMDEEMDHGPIIGRLKYKIGNEKLTYPQLEEKLAEIGADLLIKILPQWTRGKIKPSPQNHNQATFTKIIKKEDGEIDWQKEADFIERMVRAYFPWPTAYSQWQGKILKIIEANASQPSSPLPEGKVFLNKKKELSISCGQGSLILKKIQLEGGKILTAKDFLNGHPQFIGCQLGKSKLSSKSSS